MAEEIQQILTNDVIKSTMTKLSEQLGTTVDKLITEFTRFYIGTHLFWLCIGVILIIVAIFVCMYIKKHDEDLPTDDSIAIVIIMLITAIAGICMLLPNLYCLICIYCAPTITLIRYIITMLNNGGF